MDWDLVYDSWYQKNSGLLGVKNRVILLSLVWSQYQRVTDRQTDARTRRL